MKKALILALVVSAGFAPRPHRNAEAPDRASEFVRALASPAFWHLWDEFLAQELAQPAQTADSTQQNRERRRDALACFFLHIILERAFDGSLSAVRTSAAEQNLSATVSISQILVRRTVERTFESLISNLASISRF